MIEAKVFLEKPTASDRNQTKSDSSKNWVSR